MVAQRLVKIRGLKAEDISSIMSIQYKCFTDPYPISLLKRLHLMHPEGFLVAEVSGIVAGYLIGVIRWSNVGHILALAVDPAFRRQGTGTLLMKEIIDRFKKKKVKVVRLEVRKSNFGAQMFYKKLGFLERGEMPFYYEDGETAIAMELPLE